MSHHSSVLFVHTRKLLSSDNLRISLSAVKSKQSWKSSPSLTSSTIRSKSSYLSNRRSTSAVWRPTSPQQVIFRSMNMAAKPFKITVHHLNNSRAIRIICLLEELNLPYNIAYTKRTETGQAPASFNAHPLHKAPTVVIQQTPDSSEIVLHESAYIINYICEYWGQQFLPKKFKDGENTPGTETEAWRRNGYWLVQLEGTLMPNIQIALLFNVLNKSVPFFIRPLTGFISSQVHSKLLDPEFTSNLSFIEAQLRSSGGDFICGPDLAAADFLLAFCLETCRLKDAGEPLTKEKYPACVEYVERLNARVAWKRAVQRIVEAERENEEK